MTNRQHSRLPTDDYDDPSLPETHIGVRGQNRLDRDEPVFSLVAGLQGVVGFDSPELADVSRNNPLGFTDPSGLYFTVSAKIDPSAIQRFLNTASNWYGFQLSVVGNRVEITGGTGGGPSGASDAAIFRGMVEDSIERDFSSYIVNMLQYIPKSRWSSLGGFPEGPGAIDYVNAILSGVNEGYYTGAEAWGEGATFGLYEARAQYRGKPGFSAARDIGKTTTIAVAAVGTYGAVTAYGAPAVPTVIVVAEGSAVTVQQAAQRAQPVLPAVSQVAPRAAPAAEQTRQRMSDLINMFRTNPSAFRQVSSLAEEASGRRYSGGISIQEIYVQVETGAQFVRHVIYSDTGRILHETFRSYAK